MAEREMREERNIRENMRKYMKCECWRDIDNGGKGLGGNNNNNNVCQFVGEKWKLRKKKESVCELQENIITNGKKKKIVEECVY